MAERKLYKVLDGCQSMHGGNETYHLPRKKEDGTWVPGKWMPAVEGDLELCENGYHLTAFEHLLEWIGPDIYEAEYRGDVVGDFESDDKIAVRQVRLLRRVETWNDRVAREFACWCVRNTPLQDGRTVWDLLDDDRSKNAVEVAERHARGEATDVELAAARAAAWDAAESAADLAAESAAESAAEFAVRDAAEFAVRAAAGFAVRAAARAAAWDAARDAQLKHLHEVLGE